MPTIAPIYSIELNSDVYHNNTACTERNNIETVNVRAGTGGKRLCKHCQNLKFTDTYFAARSLCGGLSTSLVS